MRDVTWFLTGWHWLYTALDACLLFWIGYIAVGTARIVGDWWQEHRDAPARDAYREPEPEAIRLPTQAERAEMFAGLAPEVLDAENLPGPEHIALSGLPESRPGRAGELHYMDTWLGRPGDGSEHTALRVRREGEAMLARVEAARRELAEYCGIRYVPMELVAA